MRRRDRSRSISWRFMITGALPLNVSATSWAWLNDVGMTTCGFAVTGIGSGRTTAPRPLTGPLPRA